MYQLVDTFKYVLARKENREIVHSPEAALLALLALPKGAIYYI